MKCPIIGEFVTDTFHSSPSSSDENKGEGFHEDAEWREGQILITQ